MLYIYLTTIKTGKKVDGTVWVVFELYFAGTTKTSSLQMPRSGKQTMQARILLAYSLVQSWK